MTNNKNNDKPLYLSDYLKIDKSISIIFSIASKASFLFKSSELQEKRNIISILFTNLEING